MDAKIKANPVATVETTDELMKAIDAAQARISDVYASGAVTLIDLIPSNEWCAWDGSHEKAIVCDSDGIDGVDYDDADLQIAA